MSWFGEQLNSFTEKITDFTKDMLPDGGNNSNNDLSTGESASFSPNRLVELCKEKDAEISLLMNEKSSLERSIEELDTQHQEAINELLHLKNEAVKENFVLKNELAAQKEIISLKSLFQKFEYSYHPREVKTNEVLPISKTMLSDSLKSFNVINIIGVLWKNFEEVTMNNCLEWLEEQKLLLETQGNVSDNSIRNVINRISNYISFLQLMVENPELFSIIDEVASVIHFLLSDYVSENAKFSVPENINGQSTDNSSLSVRQNETVDFSSQTLIQDFQRVKNLFSATPEPFLCNNAAEATSNMSESLSSSQHVQTDDEITVQNCNSLIFELQQYIVHLEEEKAMLQNQVSEFGEQVSNLQEQLQRAIRSPSSSVLIQTESIQGDISFSHPNTDSSSPSLQAEELDSVNSDAKLTELQTYISILEQENSDFLEKILELQSSKSTLSTLTQTDKFACDCNVHELEAGICILKQDKADLEEKVSYLEALFNKPVTSVLSQTDKFACNCNVYELEAGMCILEQDKADLEEKVSYLEALLNKPVTSVPTQTDKFACDCNVRELEAGICILEQDKADLEEKVSYLETMLDKPVTSVHIQTDEDFNLYDLLESKISNLQQMLSLSENDYNDNKPVTSVPAQTDKFACDCNIHELEAGMCILEQDKADLEEKVSYLEALLNKPVTSIHIQTDEDFNLYDLLESKISNLQQILSLSEKDYNENQQEMNKALNNLREKLRFKESTIQEKENIIQSLEHELAECKISIGILTEKLDQVEDARNLKEKLKISESYCQEKESIIQSLEHKLIVYKTEVDNLSVKAQQVDDLNKIKNELSLKESAFQDKISIIQSLQQELEDYKIQTQDLTMQLYMVEDSMTNLKEDLKLKESAIEEKGNKIMSLERDLEDFKTAIDNLSVKAQQIDDFDKLRKELKSNESIIQEKTLLHQSLEHDIEEYKTIIDNRSVKAQEDKSFASIDFQDSEKRCSCKFYESEILELKKYINEREKEYSDRENQQIICVNNLKIELNSYENILANKDLMLTSVSSELENCKSEIKNLTDELNQLKETLPMKNREDSCSCKQYEHEIEELKTRLCEKEKQLVEVENNLDSNVSNLWEISKSKDLLIIEKEEMIQSLKLELEDNKRRIKKHLSDIKTFKTKQDYAKDIDTMEEHDIKMLIGNCNKCKSILNGETNDNDLKNEVKVLQDKLKALDMDKNQLLCVLNEKTQECSTLKAEVHKLTNIVASEKQALYKLQQDNCLLKESRDNSDPELTKEAIKNLSSLIRDKDLEIESLKQKNGTLTALIQDGTSVPDHLQSLIEEKENLTKQINVFKTDRDKIMARYNTIDKDCRQYAAEVKKLQSALSDQKEKFDVLEQKHFSVAQQYEEKQKSLINTQNEMIALKQRVSDLEQQQVDIKEKYSELLNKLNSDTVVQLTKDELEEKNSLIEQLTRASSEKDHLIQEKDCLIHDLSQQIKTLKLEHEQQQLNLTNLQTKIEELTAKLKDHEVLIEKHQNEKEALEMRFQDRSSELGLLKDMNERLNMSLKEKEFTVQSMTEKISSLSHYSSSDHATSDIVDINQILADSESMFSKAQSLYKERDETLLALNQSKQENQSLRNEIQRMKSNEIHLKKELERLRMHLLEIEENYTTEALKAEEREKELRDELVEVKRRAEISNTAIVDTNQRASIQIASLQEQLSMIANQRDQALAQVSTLEDKVQQHSASVSKLQIVLEQMQRGNERKIKEVEKKFVSQLERQKQLYKELEEKLQAKEMQLEESSQALEAASRLSEQLDAKEEIITNLKSELSKTESKIKSTAQEIDTIKSNTEGKVDRVVMKSLVLGYFSTPPGQKSEVIRLLARVLDFNQEEMEKAGIVVGRNAQRNEQRGLFSSIFSRLPVLNSERTPTSPEKSFTTLFVQFLENESQPIVPMPFPVEKMAHDVSLKQHPSKKSPTTEKRNLSRSNPLLLDIDSAFPTFTPVPAVEYTQSPAPSILREVLE